MYICLYAYVLCVCIIQQMGVADYLLGMKSASLTSCSPFQNLCFLPPGCNMSHGILFCCVLPDVFNGYCLNEKRKTGQGTG